jgi:hypothetical protein
MPVRLAALLVAVGTLLSAATAAEAQSQDSVFGQGQARATIGAENEQTFDFSATSGPSGENPSGYAKIDFVVFGSARFHVEGPVRCLSVTGIQAVVGFELDPDLSTFPANGAIITASDNGPPGSEPPDIFNSGPVPDPTSCVPGLLPPPLDVFAGDIVVTNAQPLPTSKGQCRDAGYLQFGFKNQGQCIAFVERGAKP